MSSPPTPVDKFEKVLWRKQPYADNHVPPSFLSDLRTNSQITLPSLGELVTASLRVSTRFLSVVVFCLLFVHLHLTTFDAEILLAATLGFSLFSGVVAQRGGQPDRPRRRRVGGVMSKLIMALVLLAVSPVLSTLTEATTSDSIWALAAMLFALHLVLADYSSQPEPNQHQMDANGGGAKLSNTLSFNAAISASVVLASRLDNNLNTFALLTLAITLFAPSASGRASSFARSTSEYINFTAAYTGTMGAAASLSAAGGGRGGWVVVWINVVVGFVSAVCPVCIRCAQAWKMEIAGPWDPAEPVLSTGHLDTRPR